MLDEDGQKMMMRGMGMSWPEINLAYRKIAGKKHSNKLHKLWKTTKLKNL